MVPFLSTLHAILTQYYQYIAIAGAVLILLTLFLYYKKNSKTQEAFSHFEKHIPIDQRRDIEHGSNENDEEYYLSTGRLPSHIIHQLKADPFYLKNNTEVLEKLLHKALAIEQIQAKSDRDFSLLLNIYYATGKTAEFYRTLNHFFSDATLKNNNFKSLKAYIRNFFYEYFLDSISELSKNDAMIFFTPTSNWETLYGFFKIRLIILLSSKELDLEKLTPNILKIIPGLYNGTQRFADISARCLMDENVDEQGLFKQVTFLAMCSLILGPAEFLQTLNGDLPPAQPEWGDTESKPSQP